MARQSAPDRPKRGGGRPRLIDEPCPGMDGATYAEVILGYIRLGAPLGLAAQAAGVNESTVRAWRAEGRDGGDQRYQAFLADCSQAEAEGAMRLLANIREAASGDPYEVVKEVTKPVRDANGEVRMVTERTVTRGRKRYWQAALALLERRFSEQYGPPARADGALALPEAEAPDAASESAARQWNAYLQGVRDAEAGASRARDSGVAETLPEGS